MAATQDNCSLADSMEVSCPSQEESGTVNGLPPINCIGLYEFYNLIGEHAPECAKNKGGRGPGKNGRREQGKEVTNEQVEPPAKRRKITTEHAFETLEAFMNLLASNLKDFKDNELKTYKRDDRALTDRPSSTGARPDIAIFRRDFSLSHEEDKLFWGSIEMAIKFHSAGETRDQLLEEAATYVLYLLEARPDLVSALGILVEPDCLNFFFCNVDGIKLLSLSKKEHYLRLLSAVMKYLNDGQKKNRDPTLCRRENEVLFDVCIPNQSTTPGISDDPLTLYERCSLRYAYNPFGRRPSVFIYEPKNEVSVIRVIKDQYIKKDRPWTEKDILEKIHRNGIYPAVVRMCFYGEIAQATCGDRIRVRMCLQDYGTNFLSLKTPREVIYALYDLLEVTRSLYLDRKILHRDISPNNIMIRDPEYTQSIQTSSSASPVFIRHLLNPQEPKHKTSIFLIDFGYSQDFESSQHHNEGRTGTPIFIARAVQAGIPLPEDLAMYFPDLPPLSDGIKGAYKSAYPKRVKAFNEPLGIQIGPSKNPPSSPFQHKLEHDGESGVWCFCWWSILAYPENTMQVPIDTTFWSALMPLYVGGQSSRSGRSGLPQVDNRNTILGGFIQRATNILHPGYKDLLDLFRDIARAILPDYHWAEDTIRQKPDFVHEILQRIILNFVAENKDATFMDTRKADCSRAVQGFSSIRHWSTHYMGCRKTSSLGSAASLQTSSMRSSASNQNRKRKLNENIPDSTPAVPSVANTDEFCDSQSG